MGPLSLALFITAGLLSSEVKDLLLCFLTFFETEQRQILRRCASQNDIPTAEAPPQFS